MKMTNLIRQLKQHEATYLKETPLSAAVMIMLLEQTNGDIEIVLTKRAETLPTYAGHYSLPGGMRDPEDIDWYNTATREVYEELNIPSTAYQLITTLDDFYDREGNLVRVFVTIMNKNEFEQHVKISADEIAEIYFFSLEKLTLLQDEPRLHSITKRNPSYIFKEESVYVWGLTAAILAQFNTVIKKINI